MSLAPLAARALLLGAALLFPATLAAQPTRHVPVGPWASVDGAGNPLRTVETVELSTTSTGVVTAASLLLPGTGQLLLGKMRWPAYAALEAIGWFVHLERHREGRRLRNEYRELAWLAARAGAAEPRVDGDWKYYESLEQWSTSGRWDADPARAGLQPESDPRTFNGAVWTLARDLYLPEESAQDTEAYARALEFYRERAYPPELLWDWTAEEASLRRYRELIDRSDAALRTATVVLGAVVANHLFSAADAFVAARLSGAFSLSTATVLGRGPSGPVFEWRLELRQ